MGKGELKRFPYKYGCNTKINLIGDGKEGKINPKETSAKITRGKWSQNRTTQEGLAQMFTKGEKVA